MTAGAPIGDRVGADGIYHALPDPVTDRIFSLTMALAAEVWTVRDRLRLVEAALEARGIAIDDVIRSKAADADQIARMTSDRDAFVERVFQAISPGPRPESD